MVPVYPFNRYLVWAGNVGRRRGNMGAFFWSDENGERDGRWQLMAHSIGWSFESVTLKLFSDRRAGETEMMDTAPRRQSKLRD
jgi:hypothetical protein